MLGTVVEYRNLESGEHIKRVKGFTEILAKYVMQNYPEYGLTEEKVVKFLGIIMHAIMEKGIQTI